MRAEKFWLYRCARALRSNQMLPARWAAVRCDIMRTWLRQTAARVRSVSCPGAFQPCLTAASTDAALLYSGGRGADAHHVRRCSSIGTDNGPPGF